jgi:hypothetical protein
MPCLFVVKGAISSFALVKELDGHDPFSALLELCQPKYDYPGQLQYVVHESGKTHYVLCILIAFHWVAWYNAITAQI